MANAVIYHNGIDVPELNPKDPDSDNWFGFDFSLATGEQITASSWLIDGEAVTSDGDEVNGLVYHDKTHDSTKTRVRLSGGVVDRKYRVTCRYTTTLVPSDDKSFDIEIKDL